LVKGESKESDFHSKFAKVVFHKCHQWNSWNKFAPFTAVSKNTSSYVSNGNITIELKLKVSSVSLHSFPMYDFKKPTNLSDIVLLVEGKKLYANKNTLAMHSVVFEKMFGGDFAEKNQEVVELKDVKSKIFEEFLQVIYPSRKKVEGCRVVDFLVLADQYDVPMMTALCEEFLLGKDCHLSSAMKFKLADSYKLIRLQARLLRTLDHEKAIKKVNGMTGLSTGTLETIVRKLCTVKESHNKKRKMTDDNGGMETD